MTCTCGATKLFTNKYESKNLAQDGKIVRIWDNGPFASSVHDHKEYDEETGTFKDTKANYANGCAICEEYSRYYWGVPNYDVEIAVSACTKGQVSAGKVIDPASHADEDNDLQNWLAAMKKTLN